MIVVNCYCYNLFMIIGWSYFVVTNHVIIGIYHHLPLTSIRVTWYLGGPMQGSMLYGLNGDRLGKIGYIGMLITYAILW